MQKTQPRGRFFNLTRLKLSDLAAEPLFRVSGTPLRLKTSSQFDEGSVSDSTNDVAPQIARKALNDALTMKPERGQGRTKLIPSLTLKSHLPSVRTLTSQPVAAERHP